ncbi:MBL fold metallo-hydrolase [Bacillus atrophaeus]|uniref:MBL fold metallo-hydrolase n=1 Tax=Bacillus atrophaeus TaxID=1452 RepID=UPI000D05B5CB|nr:MBL fold metallo-hydrolase [Bacillus atrophaeus]MCY8910331.1 MBL fold metallo-hydrolase [Bacillus atrophaeus]MEC0835914.1 MBL fold metallo-hydrolase [Bacillus atrophaeus]MEC0847036.1 MBL fold metallo-hydrolase [Bacillus atrophaeus]MEC0848351.1 MBL fold metallo-hydrolase [Bacillus atrophaeus]MEC0864810.1 MBL fold metallo-hydrolase [Bacillus atrophaeus]
MNKLTYEIYQLTAGSPKMLNYMYIIVDIASRQTAIVDPGWDLELITNHFSELGVEPSIVLLTHSHFDHVNMVEPLVERFGSTVYMSEKECNYYHYYVPCMKPFRDMDTLFLGKTRIQCLVTPGHTAGGSCFLLSDALFTGDTVFTEGCGVCHMEGGSPEQMFESFQRIKRIVAPHVRIFPGHSYGQPPGHKLGDLDKYNIYFGLDVKKHFVDFRMRKNQKPFSL